jgi:hypothetical protein
VQNRRGAENDCTPVYGRGFTVGTAGFHLTAEAVGRHTSVGTSAAASEIEAAGSEVLAVVGEVMRGHYLVCRQRTDCGNDWLRFHRSLVVPRTREMVWEMAVIIDPNCEKQGNERRVVSQYLSYQP